MKVRALILTVAAIANSAIAQDYQDYADGYEQDNLYQDYANKQQEQGGGGGWVFVYMLLLGLCMIHTTDSLTSLQNKHHTKYYSEVDSSNQLVPSEYHTLSEPRSTLAESPRKWKQNTSKIKRHYILNTTTMCTGWKNKKQSSRLLLSNFRLPWHN